MKIFLKLILICLLIVSCQDTQSVLYDGSQTLIAFNKGTSVLAVTIDATGTDEIVIDASTLSSQDRTFNVVLNTEKTTTDAQNFTLPSTFTIPANEYSGILTVTGLDFNLETATQLIVISLEGTNGTTIVSNVEHVISIKQVCPVTAPFAGEYAITQLTPDNVQGGDGGPVFLDQILTLKSTGPTTREFSAVYLEHLGIGQPATKVPFTLLCNDVVVAGGIGTGLACGGTPGITLGPATVPSTYNADDDSVFELTLTEYVTDGACGADPYQVTFRFTKQ